MHTRVKIPFHLPSHQILIWLNDHVGACLTRGKFACDGMGWSWRYGGGIRFPNGAYVKPPTHVITFASDVSSDIITQFALTWS